MSSERHTQRHLQRELEIQRQTDRERELEKQREIEREGERKKDEGWNETQRKIKGLGGEKRESRRIRWKEIEKRYRLTLCQTVSLNGWMDEWTDGQMGKWTNEQIDT
jgi:hypothetical protein